ANRDGLTDLAVTHQTEPAALLVNHSSKEPHWVGFTLVGRECERDAIGAVVRVTAGDETRTHFVTAGGGYMSSNERTIRVGLGDFQGTCQAEVIWPCGKTHRFKDLKVDTSWLLVQNDEAPFEMP
ncbi:MAG: ASPIC/UnbV domain-containing protein, partial [Pirellulaceae bacterium]